MDESKKWTAASVKDVPLESDELALEYLCRHDYDAELAKFNLMCIFGVGKGESCHVLFLMIVHKCDISF